MIKLHPNLDPAAVAQDLQNHSFTRVGPFLESTWADKLAQELTTQTQWDLAITGASGPLAISATELKDMPPARQAALSENLRRQARRGFSFSYLRRDVVPAEQPFCNAWARWLESESSTQTWRQLTGHPSLVRADAHACLYQPGHFLRTHDDTYSGKQRRFAYVLNFTRDWEADWGGQLHLLSNGETKSVLAPRFNSLCLFKVPQDHFVSQVASYARAGRYSITGWLFD